MAVGNVFTRPVPWLLAASLAACGHGVVKGLEPSLTPHPVTAEPAPADARGYYIQAVAAEDRGDLATAESDLQWAIRLDAGDPWIQLAWGRFLERQGRAGEARAAFAAAVAAAPDLPDAHYALGEVLVRVGDDAGAKPELWLAVESGGPRDAFPVLARLDLRAGDSAAAAEVLDRWLALPVGDDALQRARLAIDLDRPAPAVDDLVHAVGEPGSAPSTGDLLVGAAVDACRIGTAWSWVDRDRVAERPDPDWRRVALAVARKSRDPDLITAAVDGLGPAERTDPDLVGERVGLWLARGRPADLDAALALVREAEGATLPGQTSPRSGELKVQEGRVLAASGKAREALAAWASVPSTDPAFGRAVDERVSVLLMSNRTKEAADVARKAAAAVPQDVYVAWAEARALAKAGKPADADAVVAAHWQGAEAERRLADLRLSSGDVDGGLAHLRAAGSAGARRDLARWLEQHGASADAIAAWRDVAAADPSEVEADLALARLVPAEKDDWLARAVKTSPCDADALVAAAAGQPPARAVPLLERALDAAPVQASVLDALAAAYHDAGMTDREQDIAARLTRVRP